MGFKGSKVQILSSRPLKIRKDYKRLPQGEVEKSASPFSFFTAAPVNVKNMTDRRPQDGRTKTRIRLGIYRVTAKNHWPPTSLLLFLKIRSRPVIGLSARGGSPLVQNADTVLLYPGITERCLTRGTIVCLARLGSGHAFVRLRGRSVSPLAYARRIRRNAQQRSEK